MTDIIIPDDELPLTPIAPRPAGRPKGSYAKRMTDVEKRTFVSGNTSVVEYVNITQSNSGTALTGLVYNSSGLTAYYVRPGSAPAAISLATQTTTGSFSSGGFVAVDNTNMPGLYRIDIPNAVFNSGVDEATIYLRGAGNMNPLRIEYR